MILRVIPQLYKFNTLVLSIIGGIVVTVITNSDACHLS
jgi:hypothetical protein